MKIKKVDKKSKKVDMKYLAPIIYSGISLGLTCFLMKTGVIDYNSLANLDRVKETLTNIPMPKILFINKTPTEISYEMVENIVNSIGLQGIVLAGKAFGLGKNIIKPLIDKKKENEETEEIGESEKDLEKGKSKVKKIKVISRKKENKKIKVISRKKENKKMKTARNIAKVIDRGLSIGFLTYLIGTGQIDYNSVYKLENLPHQLSFIADFAKNIDLNILKIGTVSVKSVIEFMKLKKDKKEIQTSSIKSKSFSEIFQQIDREDGSLPPISAIKKYKDKFLEALKMRRDGQKVEETNDIGK